MHQSQTRKETDATIHQRTARSKLRFIISVISVTSTTTTVDLLDFFRAERTLASRLTQFSVQALSADHIEPLLEANTVDLKQKWTRPDSTLWDDAKK
jgi:hypothetical protein